MMRFAARTFVPVLAIVALAFAAPTSASVKDGKVQVGDTTDIRASNGVIHVIDSVLIPQGD